MTSAPDLGPGPGGGGGGGGGVWGGATPGGQNGASSATSKKKKPLIASLSPDERELQDNLALAAAATQTQTNTHRRMEKSMDIAVPDHEKPPPISVVAGETMMKSAELQLMTPLLHFLQLLCENHNIKLQVCVWGREGGRERGGR